MSLISSGLLILFLSGCTDKAKQAKPHPLEQVFQNQLEDIYTQSPDAVGILVHIEAPDLGISWSGAVGYIDKERSETLTIDHPALLASNTKTYVAAAILRLYEDGRLALTDPLGKYLSPQTIALIKGGGYDTSTITIGHLLNHTSGIADYNAVDGLFDFLRDQPQHVWTRDEQITRAMTRGKPLGQAGEHFNYADTNYLLLGEIIEQITGQTFYQGVRQLIDYTKQGMNDTWWVELETRPENTKALARQYATALGLASENMHPSFDLFGGGGIASTARDLGVFTQNLFDGKVYKTAKTLDIMLVPANPKNPMQGKYMSGLSSIDVNGIQGIGHGGFWGSAANYFPDLNASIAVIVLERDKRVLRRDINQAMVKILLAEETNTGS